MENKYTNNNQVKIRRIATLNPSPSEVSDLPKDTLVSFIPLDGFGRDGKIRYEEERSLGDVIGGYTYFKQGDIAIAKITPSFENGKGAICEPLNHEIGFGTTEIHVLRPSKKVDPRYLWYCLRTKHFQNKAEAYMRGSAGQQRVPTEFISEYEIPKCSLSEQKKIVEYIESESETIEKCMQSGHKLTKYLHLKRHALIQEAVTNGIKHSVDYRDSGISWVGEIPEHWDLVRIRFVARLESGHTPDRSNKDYWENTNIPWVTTSDIKRFRNGRKIYINETENQISQLGLENSGAHLLPKDTVFLSRTASVGFSGIMNQEMATSQDFANWICGDEIIPEYLLYVFRSMDQEFDRLTQGSTHQTIYMPDIRSFKTPLPPVEEQYEIIEYIQTKTNHIWDLIDKVGKIINLLKEKRQALITAAVTGHIDIIETQNDEAETIS